MYPKRQDETLDTRSLYRNERGLVTAVGLLILAALTVLGTTAVMFTSTDIRIGGNYKLSEQAFYVAEAGTEEARQRLRRNASNPLSDDYPQENSDRARGWRRCIGSETKAQTKGCDAGHRTASLQSDLDYTVVVKYKTSGGNISYWGDNDGDGINTPNPTAGENIYVINSSGSTGSSSKVVEVEAARLPPLTIPAALYVQAQTNVAGNSTFVDGDDGCGTNNLPGVATTLPNANVGSPPKPSVDVQQANVRGTPAITYTTPVMSVQAMVDDFKNAANIKPTLPTSGTLTGEKWGAPTGGGQGTSTGGQNPTITYPTPSACNDPPTSSTCTALSPSTCSPTNTNIVYIDGSNIQNNSITLSGNTMGCGILLVDGNLWLEGGFNWYGPILVTGSVHFTGGGNVSKQISGAILSGGSVDADLVGGNTNLKYCGAAINTQTANRPLRVLSWREVGG